MRRTYLPKPRAVLDRFLGRWETAATIRRLGYCRPRFARKGRASASRRSKAAITSSAPPRIPASDSELQVMTYDAEAKVYRQWVFSSDGYRTRPRARGIRPPPRFAGPADPARNTFVIDDHFVGPASSIGRSSARTPPETRADHHGPAPRGQSMELERRSSGFERLRGGTICSP